MKKCSRCKIEKESEKFGKDNTRKDKLNTFCKQCVAKQSRRWNEGHKEEIAERDRLRYEKDKPLLLEQNKKWREEHKEERLVYLKQWRKEHQEEIAVYTKLWTAEHPEYRLRYYEGHKEEEIAYAVQYQKERRKNDPIFRLVHNLRARLRSTIKNNQKVGSAVRDLGCSINFFKGYIEAQWYDNPETGEMMSWENYGLWELDHKYPLSRFDLEDRKQFLLANHFSNLQPMWAKDNRRKSNKIILKNKA